MADDEQRARTRGRPRSGTRAKGAARASRGSEASGARRPAPRRASDAQFGRLRVSWMLLVVVGLVVVGTFTLAPSVALLVEQRQDIADLEAQVAEQQEHVDELQAEVAQWDDPAYIEAQARDRLFYVYPGETAYVVLDDRDEVEAAPEGERYSPELLGGTGDWLQSGITSIVIAGLTDATPDELAESGTITGE